LHPRICGLIIVFTVPRLADPEEFMRPLLAALVVIAVAPIAHADVVTVISSRDNTLYESATGSLSNGSGENFFAGLTTVGIRRGLVFFKLDADIPAGSTVTSVALTLNVTQANGVPANFTLQRVLSNWGEGASNAGLPGGMGAAAAVNDATWLHTFFNASFWSSAGGDFSSIVSATTSVTGVGPFSWSSAQMVADVQAWVNDPSQNFGWIIRDSETVVRQAARFASRENANALLRPTLTVTFTPIPEPAGLVLAGVGLIGGWWIRRSAARR
jgi:hypothetical protein